MTHNINKKSSVNHNLRNLIISNNIHGRYQFSLPSFVFSNANNNRIIIFRCHSEQISVPIPNSTFFLLCHPPLSPEKFAIVTIILCLCAESRIITEIKQNVQNND